jgi:hypothetical protein
LQIIVDRQDWCIQYTPLTYDLLALACEDSERFLPRESLYSVCGFAGALALVKASQGQ